MDKRIGSILTILVKVEKKIALVYRNFSAITQNDKQKNIAKVMAREEERHFELYEDLLEKSPAMNTPISNDSYTKLILEFNSLLDLVTVEKVFESEGILEFALEMEKKTVDAMRMFLEVINKSDIKEGADNLKSVLNEIMEEEKNHITGIERYIPVKK
jgi:rubrerythrin